MGGDKKLETMSEEIKLLKGELKQSLASVRDYLLNMELPTSEFSNILEALDSGERQKVTMTGTLGVPQDSKPSKETREEVREAEPEMPSEDDNLIDVEEPPANESDTLAEDSLTGEDESLNIEESLLGEDEPGEDSQPETPDEPEEAPAPESRLPLEENLPMDFGNTATEASQTTPKVNMLANLINWVAKAKKEIGYDQIPTFLEVYGISGHLSAELKEVIIHLAEITAEKPEVANDPEVWSQAMLSLHGILTGGDAPLHPVLLFPTDASGEVLIEEEITEEEKPKEAPFKLKLVFPNGDGKDKEFCINLTPEEDDSNGSANQRKN
jgi:hypothetical protein